jgi:hypothetical protein
MDDDPLLEPTEVVIDRIFLKGKRLLYMGLILYYLRPQLLALIGTGCLILPSNIE